MKLQKLRHLAIDVDAFRHHRDFRIITSGQLINQLGSEITRLALPFQVYTVTHSTLAIGAMSAVQLAAVLIFALMGGAIADAINRRRLLLCTQAGLCLTSTLLTVLAIVTPTVIWPLFVVAFTASAVQSIDSPARRSLLPSMVSKQRLSGAIALSQAGFQLTSIIGPALGGLILARAGLQAAYGLDAISFLAGLAGLLLIKDIPATSVTRFSLSSIVDGLRYVRQAPFVLAGFIIDLDAMVFGLPVALFPVLALDYFRVGPEGLGLLVAAPAVGAIFGVLFSGATTRARFQGRMLLLVVAVWGVAISILGVVPFFPLACALLVVAGAADALSAIIRNTINLMTTPDHLRGRVLSLHFLIVNSGQRLGDLEATSVAALTSAQFSVVSGGLACLLGLVVVARAFPKLVAYDAIAHAQLASEASGQGILKG